MKNEKTSLSRRDFVKLSSTGFMAMPILGVENPFKSELSNTNNELEVHLFSKHLQFLDYEEMSSVASKLGFDGLDLTVRPKGHVLPERVVEDLPKAVAAMKKHGLKASLMTTNVLDVDNVEHKTVLETASKLGLSHYRSGWLDYPEERSIIESQQVYGAQFKKLETLNSKLNLIGCYQNHAGKHVGAPIWDLVPMLEATNNEFFGSQYDIRHAVVEGGSSWELGLRLIRPYIKSIVIKDFKWGEVDGIWKPINTPLGEGMVDFKRYFALLKKYKVNVPIILHLEYDLGGAEHGDKTITIAKEEVYKQMKSDLAYLKDTWRNA
ncbi:TIM barrel protein [Aurantibacter crassamenti]|uniref:sugar phosphate isomerase/epimerase family protein n=1 Tax=Aurantibacter crassamenti TaxID=1837375 RepID=UPI00193A964C|nr:TIM barrel protein [Aurantibacter crassamenti]MBM1105780.1 TIM barrel protein [Aurantibacter crassamenti]